MKRKLISIFLVVVILTVFSSTAFAHDAPLFNAKVYGGSPSKVVLNDYARTKSDFFMAIYGDTSFNTEANFTFRLYKVGSSSNRRSNSISFYLDDYYSGQTKTVSFINGGGSEARLDLRGSVPNQNDTAYGVFYGYVRF